MAKRKAKVNFIRRKGKKLFGAAKDKVLESEKNRARSRNAKKRGTATRKRSRNAIPLAAISEGFDLASKFANPKRRRKNVQEGFMAGGVFHPIRASRDYSQARAGEKVDRRTKTGKAGQQRTRRASALRAGESVQQRTRRQRGGQNPAALVLVNGAARRGHRVRGRRRKNSDDLYTGFHGHESVADVQVFGPDGTPNDLVMLGKLDEIFYSPDGHSTAKGLTNDCLEFSAMGHHRCRLASNRKGDRYFIVALKPDALPQYEPNGEFGYATRVTYQARKDHIEGDSDEHGYWHKLGEENGALPRLCTDAEGFLVFRGGDYRTEPDGIIN